MGCRCIKCSSTTHSAPAAEAAAPGPMLPTLSAPVAAGSGLDSVNTNATEEAAGERHPTPFRDKDGEGYSDSKVDDESPPLVESTPAPQSAFESVSPDPLSFPVPKPKHPPPLRHLTRSSEESTAGGPRQSDAPCPAAPPQGHPARLGSSRPLSTSKPLLEGVGSLSGRATSAPRLHPSHCEVLEKQKRILPRSLWGSEAFSEIILESSIIVGGLGQLVMLPWTETDDDISNNFWIDQLPPLIQALMQIRTPDPCRFNDEKYSDRHLGPFSSFKVDGSDSRPKRHVRRWELPTPLNESVNNDVFSTSGGSSVQQLPPPPRLSVSSFELPPPSGRPPRASSTRKRPPPHQGSANTATSSQPGPRDVWRSGGARLGENSKFQCTSRHFSKFPTSTPDPPTAWASSHPSLICRSLGLRVDAAPGGAAPPPSIEIKLDTPDPRLDDQRNPLYCAGWSLDDGRWTDPDGFISLSQKQRQKFHTWCRIPDLIYFKPSSAEGGSGATMVPVVMGEVPRSGAIRQGFVGDCSFLSSLAVLAEYESKNRLPVLSGLIYPQRRVGRRRIPVINSRGIYACRLFFNGVSRKVLLDDYVPVRRDGKLLAAHTANRAECWVTILEKSFVKLMGGSYCMQGSNPGADLYHLTGWIPETLPFRMDVHTGTPESHQPIVTGTPDTLKIQQLDSKWIDVWNLLYEGLKNGKCVACLGTSEVADAAPSGLDYPEGVSQSSGIVARHAYSILEFTELGEDTRLLFVKNPWCCVRWRGRFSPYDEKSWTPDLERELRYDRRRRFETDDGCFWIEWLDVVRWFSHLYICWSTAFFPVQREVHSKWNRSPYIEASILSDDSHLVAFNPQFQLSLDPTSWERSGGGPAEVWVLLSRHVRERKRDLAQKYLAVHVHIGNKRVTCPPPPARQGIYSNGECTLVKLKVDFTTQDEVATPAAPQTSRPPDDSCAPDLQNAAPASVPIIKNSRDFILVVSQYSQKDAFNFTVKVYSEINVTLRELPPLIPDNQNWISRFRKGEWEPSTAGGCSNNLWNYFRNPQTRLQLSRPVNVILFLESAEEFSVNLRLFRHVTATARLLRSGRVLSSGPYHPGCCTIQAQLEAGTYTLIASTFRPDQLGAFQICAHFGPLGPPRGTSPRTDREAETHFTGTEIRPLPHPYFEPPCKDFCVTDVSWEASLGVGIQKIMKIDLGQGGSFKGPISVSLRLKVCWIEPSDVVPSLGIYRGSGHPPPPASPADLGNCVVVGKGDLEGGQGDASRPVSSAAQDLYKKQNVLTLSHADLWPSKFPYYIAVIPAALTLADEDSGTPACLVPVDSESAPDPRSFQDTGGSFTLHVISDYPLVLK